MRGMVVVIAVLMGATSCLAGPVSMDDLDRAGWEARRLDMTVTLQPDAGTLTIDGEMVLRRRKAESGSLIGLGVNTGDATMSWDRVAVEIDPSAGVVLNQEVTEFDAVRGAVVTLSEPVAEGGEVTVSFRVVSAGKNPQFEVRGDGALASWVRAWYPVTVPAKEESLQSMASAPGTTNFVMPREWSSVSAGRLVERREEGDRAVEVWEVEAGTARSFCAGPYAVERRTVGDKVVSVYALSRPLPHEEEHVSALVRSIEVLESKLGAYPWPGFAVAEVRNDMGQFGAASEQGFIMVKPGFFDAPGGNTALFAHEAAHAWWGNTVGVDGPGSLMCGEALAQHGAVTAIRETEGETAASDFLEFSRPSYIEQQSAKGYFAIVERGKDLALSTLGSGLMPHTLADSKGMWVYDMLRRRVGDERYWATLRGLIARYRGKSMTLNDVRAAFIEAAPKAGLEKFFADWLDNTGAPVIDTEWEVVDGGEAVVVKLKQAQPRPVFALQVDVEVETESGAIVRETVVLDSRRAEARIETPGRAKDVRLDPERKVLMWRPAYGERPDWKAK